MPQLRIIDDVLWRAAKARQGELAAVHANAIAGTRAAMANHLNATHCPRSLLSGLLVCGCCGGPYALRGQGRYACSNHVMSGTCSNTRTIAREALEARVLAGLADKLIAPDVAAEAMRAYQEETNRLKREHRLSGGHDQRALQKAERAIKEIVAAIDDGGYRRALSDRLGHLERERGALEERLARAPQELPDLHPGIAEIYRRKVSRLAEALADPDAQREAGEAVRGLVERVTLTPGEKRGEMRATLEGDLSAIVEWTERGNKKSKTDTPGAGVSVSVVAGTRSHLYRTPLIPLLGTVEVNLALLEQRRHRLRPHDFASTVDHLLEGDSGVDGTQRGLDHGSAEIRFADDTINLVDVIGGHRLARPFCGWHASG